MIVFAPNVPRPVAVRYAWAADPICNLTNGAGLISMSALVGYGLVETKTLASLPATTYVIGSALATMPASLWMAKVGRRRGFMAGALVNVVGCAIAVGALFTRSFVLFCVATAVIGVYNAIGLQYRFAAAEVAAPADRARAIRAYEHLRERGCTSVVAWTGAADTARRTFLESAGLAEDGVRRRLDMGAGTDGVDEVRLGARLD